MSMLELTAKKALTKRENGSYFLFSEEVYKEYLMKAYEVVGVYNELCKALVKFEDIEDKAKKVGYIRGIIEEGGDHIRNEYRKTLEKELKGISFFRAKRQSLIEESVDAIPSEIFQTIDKHRGEAGRAGAGLKLPVKGEYLTYQVADDKSCVWVGLSKQYEEDLKAALIQEVPSEKIAICEKFLEAIGILREIEQEGAVLHGSYMPSGAYIPGVLESFVSRNMQGEFSHELNLGEVVTRLYIKPKK